MAEEIDPITGLTDEPKKSNSPALSSTQFEEVVKNAKAYSDPEREFTQVGGRDAVKDIRQAYSDIETDPGQITLDKIPKLYQNLEYAGLKYKSKLAKEQGLGWELWGAVAQTAAEIVGGTIEGIGYLGDLDHWGRVISGDEGDWGNWVSDAGADLKELAREVAPVYEDPFNKHNREWFLAGVPTVASFVGMMIPATGTVGALSKAGALGKAAKVADTTTDLATLLAKGNKAMDIAKTISIKGQVVKGLSTAIVSRHIENMMEANGVWQEQKAKLMQDGMSESQADKEASDAAMQVYNQNWVMLAQDLPQYMLLGRSMNATRGIKSIRQASKMGDDVVKTGFKKGLDIAGISASEGLEEAYQYVVSQDAMYMNDYANGLVEQKGFGERLGEYIKEEEFFDSVFFGALGGAAMTTMGKPMGKLADAFSGEGLEAFKKDWKKDPRVQEQMHRASKISFLSKQLAEAAEKDDKIAYDNLRNHGLADMVMEAAAVGNYDRMISEFKELQNMTPEQLEKAQVSEEFLKEIPSILKEAEEIKNMWNAETKSTLPKYVGTMVSAKYKLKKLKQQQGALQEELMKAEQGFDFGELLTISGQEYLKNEYEIKSLERAKEQAEFILKNKPHMREWEKKQLKEQIGVKDENGNWTGGSWNEQLENLRQFKEDTKKAAPIELSKKDKELIKKITSTPSLDIVKAQTRLNWNTANINSHLNALVLLGQEEYRSQIEDFQKAQRKTDEKTARIKELYNDVNSGHEIVSEPKLAEDGKSYVDIQPLNHFSNQSKIKEAEELLQTLDESDKERFQRVIDEMKSIVSENRSVYQRRAKKENNKIKRIKALKGYHRVNRLAKKLNEYRQNNDPRFRELTPNDLFISDSDVFRVTYNGKEGVLSKEEGEMVFTPNDGSTPHIISGTTSRKTLEQLGIGVIDEYAYPLEFSVEGDALGIWIGNNLMMFNTLNPLSSIKWDKNENLASITLNDSKGNPVVITNPQLVAELSEFVYLYQELVDEFSELEENTFLPEFGVTVQYNAANPIASKLYRTEDGVTYEVLDNLPLQENGKLTLRGQILNKFLDNFRVGVLVPMARDKNNLLKNRDYANNAAKTSKQTQESGAQKEAGFNEPSGKGEVSEAEKRGEEVENEVADDIENEEGDGVALSEDGELAEVQNEDGETMPIDLSSLGARTIDQLSEEEQADLEEVGYEEEIELDFEDSPFHEEPVTYEEEVKVEEEDIVTDEIWENFVDNDEVSTSVLEDIARKVRQGGKFTEKELAIYQSKAQEIEDINKKHAASETEDSKSEFHTVRLAPGLIVKAPKSNKIQIDDNGEIQQRQNKLLSSGIPEDHPFEFNFDILNDPNITEGHEVKFVHVATQWWEDAKETNDIQSDAEHAAAPIYVFYKTKDGWTPVGLLEAGNSAERKLIWEELKTKDEVKGRIKNSKVGQQQYSSKASNFRNRIDFETGQPIFQSAHDSLSTAWVETENGFELVNDAPIHILSTEGTSKLGAEGKTSEPKFYTRDLDPVIAQHISISEIEKMEGDLEGHIWAAILNPSGIYVPFKLSTSNLTQQARDKVLDLILTGEYNTINEITHAEYDSDLVNEYPKFFQVVNTGRSKFIRFKHKGIVYKIDHGQINKGLKGDKMTIYPQALNKKGKNLESVKDKKNKIIKKEITLDDFKEMMSDLLTGKKFNVINENLRTNENYTSPVSGEEFNSYEDYLTGAPAINGTQNVEGADQHSPSILQSDLWGHKGSFFFDQGVDFEVEMVSKKAPAKKKSTATKGSDSLVDEVLTPPKKREVKKQKTHKGSPQEVTTAKINDIVEETAMYGDPVEREIERDGETVKESVYINQDNYDVIERQSNAVLRFKNELDPSGPDLVAGAAVGNLVDILGREIFAGNKINFEDILAKTEKANKKSAYKIKVSKETIEKLESILNKVYKDLIENEYTVVSKDVFVTQQYNKSESQDSGFDGIGGTLDLIAIDKNGVAHIIDFKNKKRTEKNKNRIFEDIFGGGPFSPSVEYWSNQQTVYKILTEKYGVPVGSINILGVSTEYEYDEEIGEIELNNVTSTTDLVKNPKKHISGLSTGIIKLEESDFINKTLPPKISEEVFQGKNPKSDLTEDFGLDIEEENNPNEDQDFLDNNCY